MKEPLSDGWKKERYTHQEALRIVIYWRYDGPHPGIDAKPSRESRFNASLEVAKLLKHETFTRTVTIQPRSEHGIGKQGWGIAWKDSYEPRFKIDDRPRPITKEESYTRQWIELDDLISLCPGVFDTSIDTIKDNYIPKAEIGRPPEVKEAVAMAIDLMKKGKPQGDAAKEAALHYFTHEDGRITTRIDSIERAIRRKKEYTKK